MADTNDPASDTSARIGDPVRLPGVGTRVDFTDEYGSPFCVVNRDDGDVEIYLPANRDEHPTIRLSEGEPTACSGG